MNNRLDKQFYEKVSEQIDTRWKTIVLVYFFQETLNTFLDKITKKMESKIISLIQ